MKLDDEVYDECIEKIRKTMNFYGYQNREMADDILSDVSMPISRPLQETIRTQQANIERLTEQRDRLLNQLTESQRELIEWDTSLRISAELLGDSKPTRLPIQKIINMNKALIAEIEESK